MLLKRVLVLLLFAAVSMSDCLAWSQNNFFESRRSILRKATSFVGGLVGTSVLPGSAKSDTMKFDTYKVIPDESASLSPDIESIKVSRLTEST